MSTILIFYGSRPCPTELRFANNIYISLEVIDFRKFPLWQPQNFLRSLSIKSEEKRFNRVIDERSEELTEIADKIIDDLEKIRRQKQLEMVKRNGLIIPNQWNFYTNFSPSPTSRCRLPLGDISKALYREKFNFNLYSGQITMAGYR